MLGFDLKTAKGMFFDRAAVLAKVDGATRRVLSKFGAFVRQRAKSSIRKRRAISEPGQPPSSHVGLLKRLIFFAFDPNRKSVVIGPTLLRPGSKAPKLLEHGGDTTFDTAKGKQPARYRPRPFMGPAFAAEEPRLPDLWKNSVK